MASEEDSTNFAGLSVKGTPVTELRVSDIKKELTKRGLSQSGSKTQLTDRLQAQLLLEKLQQDAAQSSGDELEGKAPNIALQDDKAGQNEFVRQYLQQQQKNLEKQMEVKKQVEEERKRKSADESSADESNNANKEDAEATTTPEMTSPTKKFKDEDSIAPVKEGTKMPRPARKSSRNASKSENGQEAETKGGSRSPTPENERLRERTRSGSSSSSRSPTPEKPSRSRRGRGRRGRPAARGRRGGRQVRKESSSPSSSPEEVIPKQKKRNSNSISSRSRSRSPKMVSPEVPTRRSSRRTSSVHKAAEQSPSQASQSEHQDSEKTTQVAEASQVPETQQPKEDVKGEGQSKGEAITVNQDTAKDLQPDAPPPVLGGPSDGGDSTIQVDKSEESDPKPDTGKKESTQSSVEPPRAEKSSESSTINLPSDPPSSETSSKPEKESLPEDSPQVTSVEVPTSPGEKPNEGAEKMDVSNEEKVVEPAKPEEPPKAQVSPEPKPASASPKPKPVQASGKEGNRDSDSSASSKSSRRQKRKSSSGSSSSSDSDTEDNQGPTKKAPITREKPPPAKQHTKPDEPVQRKPDVSETPMDEDAPGEATNVRGTSKKDDEAETREDLSKQRPNTGKPKDLPKELEAEPVEKVMEDTQDDAAGNDQQDKGSVDNLAQKKDKTVRKRKWGSKTSKAAKVSRKTSSMEISSDSLKGLIGEVKLTETVFDMETEVVNTLDYADYEPEEDRRDVKVKKSQPQASPERQVVEAEERKEEKVGNEEHEEVRKVEARDNKEEPQPETEKKIVKLTKEGTKKKVKEVKKVKKKVTAVEPDGAKPAVKERVVATTRPVKPPLLVVDEPEAVKGDVSPARNPEDRVIRIASLVRPFTVNHLKALLKRHGELDEEHFWISDIKTHCLAAFQRTEDAVKARAALHGARWPLSSPKILIVDFATIEDLEHRKAESAGIALPPKKPERPRRDEEEQEREKRQKQREKEREEKDNAARESERQKRKEPERKNPVREWDRDKIKQPSRSRSRSKELEKPVRRSRSRSRDRRKRRDESREKKGEEKKKEKKQKEEEPPAKLLDDLFRKTKATPCIYWLPLTQEQGEQRQVKREAQEKERQKRLAAIREKEKEEQKKREAMREEQIKARQKERERNRERDRGQARGRPERKRSSGSRSRSRSRRRR